MEFEFNKFSVFFSRIFQKKNFSKRTNFVNEISKKILYLVEQDLKKVIV